MHNIQEKKRKEFNVIMEWYGNIKQNNGMYVQAFHDHFIISTENKGKRREKKIIPYLDSMCFFHSTKYTV